MKTEDTVFWIIVAAIIAVFGLIPIVPIRIAYIVGVESPVNFVYLVLIAILYIKGFRSSLALSQATMDTELIISSFSVLNALPNQKGDVLLIIPCYNEEESIKRVVDSVCEYGYDYIVVNDGSTDNTEQILNKNNIQHVTHIKNMGLAAAFRSGCRYAAMSKGTGYRAVVQFDGDGQHLASQISILLKEMDTTDADIVIGSRFLDSTSDAYVREASIKRVNRKLISAIIHAITGKRISDPTSGMRVFRKTVYNEFVKNYNLVPEPDGLVYFMRNKLVVREVQVQMKEREGGTSYLSASVAVRYMLRVIISILIFPRRRIEH